MAVNLTAGAISMLSSGEWQAVDLKPVLQVIDIRTVQTQPQAGGGEEKRDRYRVSLSDGSFHQQGMLATQQNELVTSQQLQKGSIVQLTNFVCNTIRERLIIIIIDLNVILDKCDLIGDVKPFPQKLQGNEPPSMARPTPQMQSSFNQPPPTFNQPPPTFNSARFSNQGPPPTSVIRPHSYNPPPQPPANHHTPPVQPPYHHQPPPPPIYTNRGPMAKNIAPPRIIPIAALNPYQGKWTIKARVTSKGELRRYNNAKGDGKVFSFDLLDSDGGEIRATCFNTVADSFHNQIEVGKVYFLSKGTLKPAQKNFNHLKNDYEITLDHTSTAQLCSDDDTSIPRQQFHFRQISEVEEIESNTVLDVIGVVTSVNPASSITRKNGQEAQKRTLFIKDTSSRSIELTLWGDFSHKEGQTLQELTDSGVFPILAVKSARTYDFNGKTLATISSSQLSINPDFPEAEKLKTWFNSIGKNTPSIPISRDSSIQRTESLKTISQIKDEKLGTSEKPDYIIINATIWHMKLENFCYTACPVMVGERKCSKKVFDNGDGKWRCDKCDKIVDECEYRYILQLQIHDHTGVTWITAFQETGEEIMGVSAKDLYFMKYEEQDDDKFMEVVRGVLHNEFSFKLKVKEESWGDEQRVKSSVVKAEKVKFSLSTKARLVEILKVQENSGLTSGVDQTASFGVGQQGVLPPNQVGRYGNQYGGFGGNGVASGGGNGGGNGECYKCKKMGHWAKDCPGGF